MRYLKVIIIINCLIIFYQQQATAQKTIHVKSNFDNAPVPFASIVNKTKNLLLFTNDKGNSTAIFTEGDSIIISCIGYFSTSFVYHNTEAATYSLKQKSYLLDTINIKNCEAKNIFQYNNLDADTIVKNFGGVVFDNGNKIGKVAIMLKPAFDFSMLKSFSFWLMKIPGSPKKSIKAPIAFSFLEVVDSTCLPGEPITNQQINYYPKNEGKQTVFLDSLRIRIPNKGIYICIQYNYNKNYEWPQRFLDSAKHIDSIVMCTGGRFDGVFSKYFKLAFYNYLKDRWFFFNNKTDSFDKITGTLKWSATIGYCSEKKKLKK